MTAAAAEPPALSTFAAAWRPAQKEPSMHTTSRNRIRTVVAQPDHSDACKCKPGPYVIATFRNGDLVAVTRMHNRLNRNRTPNWCPLPPEPLNQADWGGKP